MSKKCIILDLDHTLIQTVKKDVDEVGDPLITLSLSEDRAERNLYVRKHLEEFLKFCFDYYDYVVLWTAAIDLYVETMLPYIPMNGKEFYRIITRDRFGTSVKNLEWFLTDPNINKESTYFVDDVPHRIKGLPEQNIIVAEKFDCQNTQHDDYLLNLMKILPFIS